MSNHHFYYGQTDIPNPTFKLFDGVSGVHNLDPSLTINSTTVAPIFRYKGGDANATDWAPWIYGETIPAAGSGGIFNAGSPLLGAYDDSFNGNGTRLYNNSNDTFVDITTEDIAIELVFKGLPEAGLTYFFSKRSSSGDIPGISLYQNSNAIKLALDAGATAANTNSGAIQYDGEWYHAMCFINRDEASSSGSQWYVNGIASGAGIDQSTQAGSLTNDGIFRIGAQRLGGAICNFNQAYLAMWLQDSWHQAGAAGPTEWATIAQERFNRLTGIHPTKAEGTTLPVSQFRASAGFIDRLEDSNTTRKLYSVGDNWLRMVSRLDSNGDEINGYLCEHAVTNVLPFSQDFTTWSKIDADDLVADGYTAVDKSTTADGLTASATNGSHGVALTTGSLTVAIYTFSAWVKKGDKDWCRLLDATISTGAYFDLANGVVGTSAGVIDTFIEDWGGNWYRCGFSFTGTAAGHTFRIYSNEADNDTTFTGDGINVNLYMWGAQVELEDHMTSYIPTTGSTAIRQKDQLHYKGDDGNIGGVGSDLQGTMSCDVLFGNYDNTTIGELIVLSDGGSADDRILIRSHTVDPDFASALTRSTGGNNGAINGTTDIVDGAIHNVRLTWETDNLNMYVDGILEGTDNLVDIPNDLDRIDIGIRGGSSAATGVISNVRIYKRPTRK